MIAPRPNKPLAIIYDDCVGSQTVFSDLRTVVPNLVSIDGESEPTFWKNNVLTWQLQSPLMPNIGILMAATTSGLEHGSMRESLSIKSTVLGYINSYLASSTPETFQSVAVELVKCIMSMVVMEVSHVFCFSRTPTELSTQRDLGVRRTYTIESSD